MKPNHVRPGDELSKEVHIYEDAIKAEKKPAVTTVKLELRALAREFHSWAFRHGIRNQEKWPRADYVKEIIAGCQKPEVRHFFRRVSFDVDDMLHYVYEGRVGL